MNEAAAAERRALDRDVLEWIGQGALAEPDDARFDALALRLFAYQYAENEGYRRICDAQRVDPEKVASYRDVPAVPTGAFKRARLATFPASQTRRVFRTSGSTREARGELHLDTLLLYEASLLATFGAFVCPDPPRRFVVLAPSAVDQPDSSLSHMFSVVLDRLGTETSAFVVRPGGAGDEPIFDREAVLEHAAQASAAHEPLAVVGTAFAFVHLLDFLRDRGVQLRLPEGSLAMETGGFKGRSREMPRQILHGEMSDRLGVPSARIVNQYGMCELGSQFYETALRDGHATERKHVPPWVRTRAVDPATLEDVAPGEPGVLIHYDLVNTGSVQAVLTADLGRVFPDARTLEVIGRVEGAEARGCSIAADALLGGAR